MIIKNLSKVDIYIDEEVIEAGDSKYLETTGKTVDIHSNDGSLHLATKVRNKWNIYCYGNLIAMEDPASKIIKNDSVIKVLSKS